MVNINRGFLSGEKLRHKIDETNENNKQTINNEKHDLVSNGRHILNRNMSSGVLIRKSEQHGILSN
jgi:hypothetical protein